MGGKGGWASPAETNRQNQSDRQKSVADHQNQSDHQKSAADHQNQSDHQKKLQNLRQKAEKSSSRVFLVVGPVNLWGFHKKRSLEHQI
jgi:hypothetical protein